MSSPDGIAMNRRTFLRRLGPVAMMEKKEIHPEVMAKLDAINEVLVLRGQSR